MKPHKENHNDQGFALVVVLLVLLLVTALAAEMIFTTRTGIHAGHQAKRATTSQGLARAGINLALFHILDRPINQTNDPYVQGTTSTTYLATGKVDFQVINESGKIDLNRINRKMLSLVLIEFDYSLHEQEIFLDSIQDWRDPDDLHRLSGAENEYYETLSPPYQAKNRLFTDVGEISLVRGAGKLLKQVQPIDIFTIYNPSGRINFNMASRTMLNIMTEGNLDQIEHYFELKNGGTLFRAEHAKQILGNSYAKWQPYLAYSSGNNRHYTITASGFSGIHQPDDNEKPTTKETHTGQRIHLILKKNGGSLEYLRWSEEAIVE